MRKGEIENRLDCYYIKAVLTNSLKSRFDSFPLNKLVSTFSGGTPDKSNSKYWGGDIFWVSPKDFKGLVISESEDKITTEGLKDSSTKFVEKENVLVVVRSGVLQHTLPVAVNKIGVAINQDVKALEIKDKSFLSPYYLVFYLNTFQQQLLPLIIKHGTTVQSINTRQFDKINIPVPPVKVQNHIIGKFEAAYNAKRAKESEARRLLKGIDAYLLERLGIARPSATGAKKTFFTRASKLSGGRFDPSFHEVENQMWVDSFFHSTYPIKQLREISTDIFQGISQNLTDDDSFILLKVKNIRVNNSIDFENVEFVKGVPKHKILQTGDIITPFIGEAIRQIKFSVFPKAEKQYTVDNNTGVIRLKENVLPNYVSEFFMTSGGCWQLERLIGGGVPFIGSNNAGKLIIPLPPLEIQEEIAAHIQSIRERAGELQREARAEVERTKAEVEKMILGEVSAGA